MDTKDCMQKLKDCRTFAEAKPILEAHLSPNSSAHEFLRLGYSVRNNNPEVFETSLHSAIREMEEEEKKKENGVQEADGGESHQESSQAGTTNVGTNAPESDTSGANSASGENQMKETYGMMPPQQGQMPPQGQIPPKPVPPMQQMQYTQQLESSLKKLNAKVQELEKKANTPTSLNVGDRMTPNYASLQVPIKETTEATADGQILARQNRAKTLTDARSDIAQYNNYLHENKIDPRQYGL